MGGIVFSYSCFLILAIFFRPCLMYDVACDNAAAKPITSLPRSCPLPPNLQRDFVTIQGFKNLIKYDPIGVTKQWKSYNVCTYQGFACDRRPDRPSVLSLARLDFNGYEFAGGSDLQIQNFVEQLFDLSIFHLNSNNFTGFVPEIGIERINFLHELDLSNNNFLGGFPTTVLGAKKLTFLDIRFNCFCGSIPAELFKLDLDVLFLNNNQFDSCLPSNIGETPAIFLTFANNYFSGEIPSSIGKAKNLKEVLFLNNMLTGCLPYEIGLLSKMTLFDASNNKLTGPIPHSFACLAKMEILNLAKNQFLGAVPEMLCGLPNLGNLSLSSNYFTQVGTQCRKLIAERRLDVRKNCILDLPDQRTANECRDFFSKTRLCPNEKSLNIVPCMKHGHLHSNHRVDDHRHRRNSTVAAAPPRSYDALSPNNKIRF